MRSVRGKFLNAALLFTEEELAARGSLDVELYVPAAWFSFLSEVSSDSLWYGHFGTYGIWGSWDPRNSTALTVTNFEGRTLFQWPLPDPLTIGVLQNSADMETPARLYPLLLSDGFSSIEALQVCASLSS
jgi:hypothetical protein